MSDANWFQKKWGKLDEVPMDDVYKRLAELEEKVQKLEEENIETTNVLYEIILNKCDERQIIGINGI